MANPAVRLFISKIIRGNTEVISRSIEAALRIRSSWYCPQPILSPDSIANSHSHEEAPRYQRVHVSRPS